MRVRLRRSVLARLLKRPVYRAQKLKPSVDASKYPTSHYAKMTYRMAAATVRSFRYRHKVSSRLIAIGLLFIFGLSMYYQLFHSKQVADAYDISGRMSLLLTDPVPLYAEKLVVNPKDGSIIYNQDYAPASELAGNSTNPKITAAFMGKSNDGTVNITDPVNQISVGFKPLFDVMEPLKNHNRVIYPIEGGKGTKVYTVGASGIKEDILFNSAPSKDAITYEYEVNLPPGVEMKLRDDGSIAFMGVESALLGNVATSTENDAKLLEKARQNGAKNQLLFRIPAPYAVEKTSMRISKAVEAEFEVTGNSLKLHTRGLHQAQYPLSIDPTIYVETARKFMRGNNETNTDFDIDNELIQKSQTTGARIDAWEGTQDMSEGIWDHGVAAAGGYVYRSGGRTGITKPQIVASQTSSSSSDTGTFTVSMPSSRPAGDLYIALLCHDGTVTVTPPVSGGWTEYADTREHAAYYKIGTDAGGGNEAASYNWTGSGSEEWYGVVIRVTGFDTADPISGTAGTGSSGSDTTPVFPATTPVDESTLVIRAAGVDADAPSATAWTPSAHTKIASGSSGGANDCGFVSASLDSSPAAGVSTGTATMADSSMNDTYGASSIAIAPEGSVPTPQIAGTQPSSSSSDTLNFVMNMPSTRPAGDLYVALMCHDGTVTVTPPVGGGWQEFADTREHAAYYKIGTNVSGGNEAASYTFTGSGSEAWYGVVIRVTGFNASDIEAGTPTTGSSGSNTTPVYPTITPDANKTLIIRSTGVDDDVPTATGWVPSGHTKIDSGTSGGANDCGFTAASLDNSPASGVATGTATLGEMNDTYGASTIAINADVSATPETVDNALDWAGFSPTTLALETPVPGDDADCSGWCSDPTYNLPEARRGHSMVAYNGYLYVIGGYNDTGTRESTIYIAKLGANGEPQLWHPTDPDKDNWSYWYEDTGLSSSTGRSYLAAVPYNNRLYILGGQTNASTGGTTTSEYADIKPNGTLGSWSSGTALPSARYGHTAHIYNDTLYLIGGNSSGTLQNTVHFVKLSSSGGMNSWVATTSFTTGRSSLGGSFTTIWGAYVYLSGGCTAVNGSGYCTTIASDTQVGSINADGSISEWGSITNLTNSRTGYTIIGWQNGLYRIGGCANQSATTGKCLNTLADVDYGVINPAGEVSTVNISSPSGSGNCTGGSPHSCNLPSDGSGNPGDDAGEVGHMLNVSVILNGHLYVIGGCAEYQCNDGGNSPTTDNISSNTAYAAIASNGTLSAPSSCGGTSYGAWCVDSTNTINGADGVAAAGVAVFNNRIYVVGGIDSTGGTTGELYYNSVHATNGSLSGAWQTQTLSSVAISEEVFYTYAYARANPSQAGTYDGNLYLFGGCGNSAGGAGCSGNDYETEVYKCWIEDTGEIETTADSGTFDCTTTGQLQIDSTPGTGGTDGLGIHSGTVYANYIYLIGGFSQAESDKDDVIYAKFDDSNNVVAASGSTWIESPHKLSVGRRRGWAFGYNGHIYAVGGYDDSGTGIIPFIEWSKINVSDGSIDDFITSTVTINQRWGLSMAVSNSYAYVIGGCDVGASPGSCSSFEPAVQTFQLYNNDSGTVNNFTAMSDDTYATNTDRIGASAAVHNGYIYVAGGCTNITCTTLSDNTQFASISASDGTIGNWSDTTDATLTDSANGRAWGQLEVAGGTLYYMGGIDSTGDEKSDVYYGTIAAGNVSSWTSTTALPADRAYHGGTVWNDRLYVVAGNDDSAADTATVYVSSDQSSGGAVSSWSSTTSINVARIGAAVTAYANNLYVFGGYDGANYLSDVQFASIGYKTGTISQSGTTVTGSSTTWTSGMVGSTIQYPDGSTAEITAFSSTTSITVDVSKTVAAGTSYVIMDGSVGSWSYTTNMPAPIRDADAVAANGYIYVIGGRSATSTCTPNILITPISANTTIATNNQPTGVGEWYETNVRYTGDRYGSAVAYDHGKIYTMGGGCSSVLSSGRHYYSTVRSQPQVAIYSRMIDTDSDVFPTSWLMNGLDNSTGARWRVKYRSMNDTDGVATDCGSADMTTWGSETDAGNVVMGDVTSYVVRDGSNNVIDCARYFYFYVSIDASKTFGYPEDVTRGPTIHDLSLFFTSDPNKRLRHGKTFTGGEQQPLDTPCRQTVDANCPLP